ncbi:lamin tail domain-containing protein [Phaeodactylibacter sp.]|uniref:lamin tail domain-containing protein n=1 Tax=Phaeodactylibacter sp. TaxID=1940289 RepID=UPI0025EBB31E|nr:lamin tail domain-containing protein [Phaeodactylibacter sp.]MCI4648305.1 lamin tail domain-containing protein [Phaeodactylibacter sp.]MCI5090426.1 lamin tail domain-containing protein [Phaeodactylibacter sp.]
MRQFYLLLFALCMFGTTLQAQVLNELLVSTTGTDVEFIEIYGEAGTPLLGLSVIGVESDDQSSNGSIDFRFDFGADDIIGSNGFYLIGTSSVNSEYGVMPNKIINSNSLENSSATYGLVVTSSISGSSITGGEFWRDVVALTDEESPEFFYFDAPVIGPDGNFFPAGVRRVTDGVDTDMASDWVISDFNLGNDNTPTAGTPMMPSAPVSGCDDLFISEYMEGSGNNKCIEVFNPTSSSIDLNAGNYQILFYFNDNTTVGGTINLTGTVSAGTTYTLCDDGTTLEIEVDQESTASFFNGNDAVELRADGTTLDIFGQIGNDSNFAKDRTYRRKSSVTSGDTNGSDAFDISAEWDEFPQNTADGFGAHTFDGCGSTGGGGGSTGGGCGFTNVSFSNLSCGTGAFAESSFFDVSAVVSNGSGSYLNINPETSIGYGIFSGVENGTISGTGQASITGNTPGEVAKIDLLDQMDVTCRTPTYYFRVPECVSCPTSEDIFISEFHYDNVGGDVNEFVEVAVSNEFEGDLSGIEVVLYNGSNNTSYDSETLDNFSEGSTASGITYYYFEFSSLQNGAPDGIALECNNEIFQLLSYEGDMTVNGFASTDVGVTEGGGTPEEGSLQLIDGVWTETCQNTKGGANADVDCCEDPTFECVDNDVLLDFGSYSLSEADVVNIDNQDNPSDCPEITLGMISPATLTCDDLGQTVMVTVMVNTPEGPQSCTSNITVVDESGELPAPWGASDVGEGENEFSYEVCNANNGEFAITSGGRNFPLEDVSDNTGFISQELCGDGSITIKVESRQGGFPGIAIRESTAAGAKMVTMLTNITGNIYWSTRYDTDANRSFTSFYRPFPRWLRLVRQGDYIIGYSSTTGGSFAFVNAAYVPMDACVEVGMVVFSVNNTPASAVFSNVTVLGNTIPTLSEEVQEAINGISLKRGAEAQNGNAVTFEVPAQEVRNTTLFPNPTRDALNLRFERAVEHNTIVVVRNQFGQALRQQQVATGAVQTQLDVAALPAGMYFLEVQGESGILETLRFTKQ